MRTVLRGLCLSGILPGHLVGFLRAESRGDCSWCRFWAFFQTLISPAATTPSASPAKCGLACVDNAHRVMQRDSCRTTGTADCLSRCQQWANRNRRFGSARERVLPYEHACVTFTRIVRTYSQCGSRQTSPAVSFRGQSVHDPIRSDRELLRRCRKTTSTATLPSRPVGHRAPRTFGHAARAGAAGVARFPCGYVLRRPSWAPARVPLCGQVILSDQKSSPPTNASVTITGEVWPRRTFLQYCVTSHRSRKG